MNPAPEKASAPWPPKAVLATLVAVVVVFGVGDVLLRSNQQAVHAWANGGWTLSSFLAGIKCMHTSRRVRRQSRRRAWLLWGIGCFFWVGGMLIWSYMEHVMHVITPFPAVSEFGFQGLAVFLMAGFFVYGGEGGPNLTLKRLGDLGLLLSCLLAILAMLYLDVMRAESSTMYVITALGYPVLHLATVALSLRSIWQRDWGVESRVLWLQFAAVAVLALVTTLYGHSLLTHSYEAGNELDVYWVATFCFIIAAAYQEDALGRVPLGAQLTGRSSGADVIAPAVALGTVVLVTFLYRDHWVDDLAPIFLVCGLVAAASLGMRSVGAARLERDLVEEMRAKDLELQQAEKMKALGTLASGIAHDFNNLLTGMMGGMGLLRRRVEDQKIASYLDLMEQSMLRAAELSQRLRTLSRKRDRVTESFDPVALTRRVATLVERGSSGAREVQTVVEDSAGFLQGDAGQLEQALLNMGINAQHATEDGGLIEVGMRLDRQPPEHPLAAADTEYLVLWVHDTGVGIPEDIQARVFEPFFTTRLPEEGTGLGLAMVYAAAKEHDGFARLDSAEGEGTTVELWIPAREATVPTGEVQEARAAYPPGHERVMVIDDRDGPLLAAKAILEDCGYEVLIAWSAVDGLAKLQERSVELVLTDAVMPEMGGRDVVAALRERGDMTPAILMSGHHEEADDIEGFAAFLRKPFKPTQLAQVVRRVLDEDDEESTTYSSTG